MKQPSKKVAARRQQPKPKSAKTGGRMDELLADEFELNVPRKDKQSQQLHLEGDSDEYGSEEDEEDGDMPVLPLSDDDSDDDDEDDGEDGEEGEGDDDEDVLAYAKKAGGKMAQRETLKSIFSIRMLL
jgi:hypothetical protein